MSKPQPQPQNNLTQFNESWVWHENDFAHHHQHHPTHHRNSKFSLRAIQGNINQCYIRQLPKTIILDNFLSNFGTEQFWDRAIFGQSNFRIKQFMNKTIYGQSKVMGFDPKVINLVEFKVIKILLNHKTSWAELGHTRIHLLPLQFKSNCIVNYSSQLDMSPKIALSKNCFVQKLLCPNIAFSKNCFIQKLLCPKNCFVQ